ncbi:DUF1569 domain-containing protein [Pleionea sediminis]|uniref:DUF1569 domain-containing protein n=1 Tax=Pleionea sediminis TaxID=2569479 RepID=UPI0013DDC902|nr:DUF1569 domain-containing protein [Pleionea sediminis]
MAGAVSGWSLLKSPSANDFQSLQSISEFIDLLPENLIIESKGVWTPYQVMAHIRQSIQFSISGFPEVKSELFQNTLGILAFHIFDAKGASTHGLSTPIPGAQKISPDGDVINEIKLLSKDIKAFLLMNEFKPHFAYGKLNIENYQKAHLFHINEHFEELDFKT